MNIVIYGIGGVGGYFGGRLAQTNNHITFIARGTHLKAIRENGLIVKSICGDFTVKPTLATDNIAAVKNPDLIILAVKSWQLADVAEQLKPILAKHTMVLPLQNGADNADKLLKVLSRDNVLAGLCRIISFVEAPGKICHKAFDPEIVFGELNNERTDRVQAVKKVFDNAGFHNHIPEDIQLEIWRKFLFITTLSGIGGLTRAPIGVMRSDDYIRDLMLQTAAEITAVARAKGIALSQNDIKAAFKAIDRQAPDATSSTQRDIIDGKASELDNFNGYIVREGKKYGIPTPVNEFVYRCLLPMENSARKYLDRTKP